ncbi:MAG: hypothetical protein LC623_04675, partial [Halobacteriales archaeon]|nr:hypothetical protein [Halobacteriales archaeon]
MKTPPIALLILAMLTTAVVPVSADGEDPAQAACMETIDSTRADFDAYPDGLPLEVAAAGFVAAFRACYVPDTQAPTAPQPQPEPLRAELLDLNAGLEKTCSGGGSTLFNWHDQI